MPASQNIAAYADVERVLRAALTAGGGTFHAVNARGEQTPGAGINWLQRARYLMRLMRDREERLTGTVAVTEFDELSLIRRCPCKGKCARAEGECVGHIIDILVGVVERGELFTLDGDPVALPAAEVHTLPLLEAVDPLVQAALDAKRALALREASDGED